MKRSIRMKKVYKLKKDTSGNYTNEKYMNLKYYRMKNALQISF